MTRNIIHFENQDTNFKIKENTSYFRALVAKVTWGTQKYDSHQQWKMNTAQPHHHSKKKITIFNSNNHIHYVKCIVKGMSTNPSSNNHFKSNYIEKNMELIQN